MVLIKMQVFRDVLPHQQVNLLVNMAEHPIILESSTVYCSRNISYHDVSKFQLHHKKKVLYLVQKSIWQWWAGYIPFTRHDFGGKAARKPEKELERQYLTYHRDTGCEKGRKMDMNQASIHFMVPAIIIWTLLPADFCVKLQALLTDKTLPVVIVRKPLFLTWSDTPPL